MFIVGCPRSGTTLLRRLVDTHPHIAIIHQSRFIPNFFERRRGLTPEGLVTTKLVDRLLEARGVKNLETSRELLESLVEAGEPVSYSTFVTGVFDLYGKRQGKRLVGDKTPGYVRRIPTLHALWPEAKFVHIIRDGRDVCMSAISWSRAYNLARRFSTWGEDPITTAAVWWEWHVRLGREDGGSLAPKLYHEVRYE
ncbi:MAG TPA: sulfotransferase, partial [Rubrobacter sp.]|nr:sulfotransferase [Rubrobacter sp.]